MAQMQGRIVGSRSQKDVTSSVRSCGIGGGCKSLAESGLNFDFHYRPTWDPNLLEITAGRNLRITINGVEYRPAENPTIEVKE